MNPAKKLKVTDLQLYRGALLEFQLPEANK